MGIAGGVFLGLWILYFIVGLITYHRMFDVIYFNVKGITSEIGGAIFFGALMSYLSIYHWKIACIILLVVGIIVSCKIANNTIKLIGIIITIAITIIVAVVGHSVTTPTTRPDAETGIYNSKEQLSNNKVALERSVKLLQSNYEKIKSNYPNQKVQCYGGISAFNSSYADESRFRLNINATDNMTHYVLFEASKNNDEWNARVEKLYSYIREKKNIGIAVVTVINNNGEEYAINFVSLN